MTRLKNLLLGTVGMAALSSFAPAAYAADLQVKAFDDLTVKFYGTLDVNGLLPKPGTQAPGDAVPTYFLFANTFVPPQSFCSIGSNGLSVSNMGFTVEKPIGYGITAIGRAETFFSPLTGQVLNGVGTVAQGNTMVFGNQVAYGDSNSAGQFLNGDVYAGLSSKQFGTVTVGRLKSLEFDDFLLYDPFAQSLAFSMIGYYGGGAGTGDTEDRRWDNSAKWVWDNGVFHVAAQGSTGCNDCGQAGGLGGRCGPAQSFLGGFLGRRGLHRYKRCGQRAWDFIGPRRRRHTRAVTGGGSEPSAPRQGFRQYGVDRPGQVRVESPRLGELRYVHEGGAHAGYVYALRRLAAHPVQRSD